MKSEIVKVELSEEELGKIATKLASSEKSLSEAEQRLEDAADAWKATQKALKTEIETSRNEVHELAHTYRTGSVDREVEVDERVVDGVVHVFRVDTGATLRTKPLEADHQYTINDAEAAAEDAADESSTEEI